MGMSTQTISIFNIFLKCSLKIPGSLTLISLTETPTDRTGDRARAWDRTGGLNYDFLKIMRVWWKWTPGTISNNH